MKSRRLSIGLAGSISVLCAAFDIPAVAQTNSVQIRSVAPAPGVPLVLTHGLQTRMTIVVNYVLGSTDRASLQVYAQEYPESAGGCRGDAQQTDGGGNATVLRGQGTATITLIWPANATPAGDPNPYFPAGYFNLGANYWTADQSRMIQKFGVFPQFCYHFGPAGSVQPNPPNPPGRPNPPVPPNPPVRPNPPPQPRPSQFPAFYRWLPASAGLFPNGAVSGGSEGNQTRYICRAVFDGNLYPGKLVGRNCNFSAADSVEHLATSYEVLANQNGAYSFRWQRSVAAPANAVIGGRLGGSPGNEIPLYICQLPFQGGLHSGWVNQSSKGPVCSISYGGKEADLPGFSYLVPMKGHAID